MNEWHWTDEDEKQLSSVVHDVQNGGDDDWLPGYRSEQLWFLTGKLRAAIQEITERHEIAREKMAAIQHNIWSSWMIYMFGKCVVNQFGDWIIPKDLVVRWQRQMHTAYAGLPEGEKQSDRDVLDEHGVIICALEEPADETD